jgi:Uma2 family endonuclease
MVVQKKLLTADMLWNLPADAKPARCELVDGLIEPLTSSSATEAAILARLASALGTFAVTHNLGRVITHGDGFMLLPDTVRIPSIGFISAPRVLDPSQNGYYPGAPDLAVEIITSGDEVNAVRYKVLQLLDAGTPLLWVVYPTLNVVDVFRSVNTVQIMTIDDTLDGGDVLPGFALPLRTLFQV